MRVEVYCPVLDETAADEIQELRQDEQVEPVREVIAPLVAGEYGVSGQMLGTLVLAQTYWWQADFEKAKAIYSSVASLAQQAPRSERWQAEEFVTWAGNGIRSINQIEERPLRARTNRDGTIRLIPAGGG